LKYDSEIREGKLTGNLHLEGNGDPTLGSWRWNFTREDSVLDRIVEILNQKGIQQIGGDIFVDDFSYSLQPVPDGWIWQDIGNYYGAGCWSFNWRENQYDLVLKSGKNVGEPTSIVKTIPSVANFSLFNFITAARKNSGDNGYVYAPPFAQFGFTTGTIPVDEKTFVISGSMPRPALQFSKALEQKLKEKNITVSGQIKLSSDIVVAGQPFHRGTNKLDSISSPELDSVNYWFMRKSINLYGEALVKAIASRQQGKNVTTEKGVDIVKNFWNERGIEKSAINIIDGSGLSPQNRVTTHALVAVLQFAKTRPWYRSFYQSLPEYNGMKIKSGTIGGVKSFAGYHTSSGGKEYMFAIIVNNYNGSSGDLVKKIYKVLDVLK
ncbi:MAG TPA: D-alanyl-D-alanine carboxypeptidase/D-alanyl-D-alanine-endopeptidase, partial [Flavitalea sp.]|nr:D-alanyl-D-alanine carboxypeptidase/D-alanyl-D-alanine-endopeptidase [Flavitalea sp.]